MFRCFKNIDIIEGLEPDSELQAIHHEDEIGTQVPTNSSGTRPVEPKLHASKMHRGLKSRHVQLIALGGSIGTGLFVGTGTTLSLAGPAALFMCTYPDTRPDSLFLTFVAFVVISVIVWTVVQSLAEMTTYLPIEGASVPYYVHRFFEPSLAFAAGWNYWYSYAMLVAAEISAASVVIDYWANPVYVVTTIETRVIY